MFRQFALLTLGLAVMVVDAMDKYQDALDKYSTWKERHGVNRDERNVHALDRSSSSQAIFVPHRPKSGGLVFLPSDFSSKQVVRTTRNNKGCNFFLWCIEVRIIVFRSLAMVVCHWAALLFIRRGRPIPIMAEEREMLIEYLFGFHDKPGGHFLTQQRVVLSSTLVSRPT